MNLKSKKGFTIIEMLVALLIMGILSTLVTAEMIYGFQTFNTSTGQMSQQYKVMEGIERIRKDVNHASAIRVDNDFVVKNSVLVLRFPDFKTTQEQKYWRIQDNKLWTKIDKVDIGTNAIISIGNYIEVIGGIDTEYEIISSRNTLHSWFEINDNQLYFTIKPIATNKTMHLNRNVNQPIITDFSVLYKDPIP